MWEARDFALTAVVSITTLVLSRGLPYLQEWLKFRTSDNRRAHDMERGGYSAVISRLDKRIESMEKQMEELRNDLDVERKAHVNCLIEQQKLRGEIEAMKHDIDRNTKRLGGGGSAADGR